MRPWLHYLIAFIVFCHGFIYVRIGAVLPGPIAEWNGTSWLLGGALTGSRLTTAAIALHVVAGIAILGAAAAMTFPTLVPGWWRPLLIGGSAIGIAAFAVFWDGQVRYLFEEGAIGALVSLGLLAGALTFPRTFG